MNVADAIPLIDRILAAAGEPPAEFESGNTYYLMELNGEWVIVAVEGWVT